ncbi:MAG: glycosyl hydrolase family 28-related protein [Phycisphaerae bacterium]
MSQENQNLNPVAPGRIVHRRHFLGTAAVGIAGLAAPIMGGGLAMAAAPPPEPISGNVGEPYLDVRKFGARGDGNTDDTASIQKAVNQASAVGNKLIFPAGRFLVSSAISGNFAGRGVWLAGAGQDVTFLITDQPNASIFSFSGNMLALSDMTIMGSNQARSGALVTTKCATENITRCLFSTYYNGIMALGNVGLIRDCSWQLPQSGDSNGLIVDGYAGGMTVDNAVMYVPHVTPNSGIKALNCGALQIANSNIMKQNHDLLIAPSAGRGVFSVNAINTFFDTATTGINISPQGGAVARCSFTQCWASSHIKSGVYIGGTGLIDGIQFIGLQINFCRENGLSINAPAKNIMVEGGEGVHNKMAAISIGNHVTGMMINHFFGGSGFGGSGRDYGNDYGIVIGKGCDNYQIANCHLLGNRSGAMLDHSSSSATNRIVVNNMV